MTVVVIVGVLATLGMYGFRKYINSAKTTEAIHVIGAIKTAQENFKDETFTYHPASNTLTDLYPVDPITEGGKVMRHWGSPGPRYDSWRVLGVQSDKPLQFGFACIAGEAGGTMSPPAEWSDFDWKSYKSPNEAWYVVNAVGDLDQDGVRSVLASSNFESQIYIKEEGE